MICFNRRSITLTILIIIGAVFVSTNSFGNPLPVAFKAQVPPGEWANTNNCGQTSALMAMCYYLGSNPTEQGIKDIDDWLFQKYGDPINNYNGSVTNTAKLEAVVKEYGGFSNSYRDSGWSLTDLKESIDNGRPIITAITASYLSNRGYSYAGGHFIVVIGYTDTDIICNDPGTNSGEQKFYSNDEFSLALASQGGAVVVVLPNSPQNKSLARIQGADPVFWLQNGKAYHVLGMEIINDMSDIPGWGYVCDYSSDVLEITPAGTPPAEGAFEQGPDFISTNPESNDLLIQLTDDPKVYLIEDGERRWITTEAVFNNLGYDWGNVIVITQAILNLIPEGEPITEEPEFYLLSGTLTNADGDPVPGWVYASETTGANLGNQVYTSNGTYEMALFPGTYSVHARVYYSYPSGSYYISTPSQTITISANATLNVQVPSYELYHLTGKVSDTNGVGLANISVQANDSTGTCQSYSTTDNSGSYDALLIGGTYSLYFRPPQDSIFLEKKVNNVSIYSDTTQNISLNSSEHRLSGALAYADGSPAQGRVYANEVSGATYRYVWSSDGTYQMALVPGDYRVYAQAYTSYPPGYTWITTPYQTITVSGDTHRNIDVPSHDLYHLTGKVTDINDIIQSNVRIDAYDSSGICYGYTTTAADGSYELILIPGTYRLIISAPPATYPPFEIKKLTITGDSVRNIRLSLEYTLLEEALSLLPDDLDVALDVFDIIDQAAALNYDISVQGAKGLLQIILNWAGSEMKVTLYDPDGNVYGEYQSTEPPINVEIPNPTEGTWKCEVTAVDVPHDNYPFALVAGISPNELPVADANGPYSGAVDSPITFDASGSYDPDGNIVSYEWDWDGDGNFDESTDSDTITHTWIKPYSGTIVLRVKDNEGATSTDSAYVEVGAGSLLAEVDINPDVLNLKSKGNWITSYIELPEGYAAENIDVSTVTLEGTIPAESSPTQVGDHDDDGIPDLMVKFDRQTLIGYLGESTGEVTLTLTGDVDGKPFEGSDTIIVIGKE